MKKLILLFTLVPLLMSCTKFDNVEISEIDRVNFKGFENNNIKLELRLKIDNPNKFKIVVDNMDLKVYVNNSYLGRISSDEKISIARKSNQFYEINTNVRLANIFTGFSVFSKVQNQGKANIKVEGQVSGHTIFWKKTIDVSQSQSINF